MFKHQDLQMFGLKLNTYDYFYPLEVEGRGSETELQLGENLNKLPRREKGYPYIARHDYSGF